MDVFHSGKSSFLCLFLHQWVKLPINKLKKTEQERKEAI